MMCAVASAADSVMVMMKTGRGKTQEDEHQHLAAPARKQFLEDRDTALTTRAELGHAVVHRQRAEQRQQHEHQRREREMIPAARNAMPG